MTSVDEYPEFRRLLDKAEIKGAIFLVEGKKDKGALEKFGIKEVITLDKPIYSVVEDIVERKKPCVILTDLDKEGKKLYGKLNDALCRHGVKVDNTIREFLFRKTKLRQIEGVDTYFSSELMLS